MKTKKSETNSVGMQLDNLVSAINECGHISLVLEDMSKWVSINQKEAFEILITLAGCLAYGNKTTSLFFEVSDRLGRENNKKPK